PIAFSVMRGNLLWPETNWISTDLAQEHGLGNPQLQPDAGGIFHLQKRSPAIGHAVGGFDYVTNDIVGQPRISRLDIGAEPFSEMPAPNRILTPAEVGVDAP